MSFSSLFVGRSYTEPPPPPPPPSSGGRLAGMFSNVTATMRGFTPLSQSQEEPSFFDLTAWQCFLLLPVLILKPSKFATCFTLGSLFSMLGFAILKGPTAHLKHMFSKDRLTFTVAYVGSMVGTLYFSLLHPSFLLTLLFSVIQVGALIWYLVSYLPGGSSTLSYGSQLAAQGMGSMLV